MFRSIARWFWGLHIYDPAEKTPAVIVTWSNETKRVFVLFYTPNSGLLSTPYKEMVLTPGQARDLSSLLNHAADVIEVNDGGDKQRQSGRPTGDPARPGNQHHEGPTDHERRTNRGSASLQSDDG